jgi:hypothetical protein
VVAPEIAFASPAFAQDGGEEPEIAWASIPIGPARRTNWALR